MANAANAGKYSKKMAKPGDVPLALKAIKPYLSVAKEHDARDPVVAYYCKSVLFVSSLETNQFMVLTISNEV